MEPAPLPQRRPGLHVNPFLTAAGVAELAQGLCTRVAATSDISARLADAVEVAYQNLAIPTSGGRRGTARAVAELTESLRRAPDGLTAIRALADATLPGTAAALAKSLSQAARVAGALDAFRWERLAPLRAAALADGERGTQARAILGRLASAVTSDEFAVALPTALEQADQAIFDWLAASQPVPLRPDDPPKPRSEETERGPDRSRAAGGTTRPSGEAPDAVLAQLRSFLDGHADEDVTVEWRFSG